MYRPSRGWFSLSNLAGVANANDMKIEAAILELVDRGKTIDGQAYPYSPSLAGATMNARSWRMQWLQQRMQRRRDSGIPAILKPAVKTAIVRMRTDGRLVVAAMKVLMANPGRFRGRALGLKAVPI